MKKTLSVLLFSFMLLMTTNQSKAFNFIEDKSLNSANHNLPQEPAPSATFITPADGTNITENFVDITLTISANGNNAVVGQTLQVYLGIMDHVDPYSYDTDFEFVEQYQNIFLTSSTDTKTITFTNVPLFFIGDNFIVCGMYSKDYNYDNYVSYACGGNEEPDYLTLNYSGSKMPVYRYFNQEKGTHFYTMNRAEKRNLDYNNYYTWSYEGVAFYAYKPESCENKVPVNRFYSAKYESHFYTSNNAEKENLIKTDPAWRYENVALCGETTDLTCEQYIEGECPIPVYRFRNKLKNSHFYTANIEEKNSLISSNPNWVYEGEEYKVY